MESRITKAMEKVIKTTIRNEMELLRKQLDEQKQKVAQLEANNIELSKNNIEMSKQVNDLQQYIRRENVLITNYPHSENENIENIVCKLGEKIGVPINFKQDVQAAHRNPSRNAIQPIIVRFVNRQLRNKFVQTGRTKKLRHGDNYVYFNDHLTPMNSKIFFEARSLYKAKKLKGAWTSNGTVMIRRDDLSAPMKILHLNDLKPFQISYANVAQSTSTST
ncbi:hypothetical protein WDU94_012390 [Cyamophila willieti]